MRAFVLVLFLLTSTAQAATTVTAGNSSSPVSGGTASVKVNVFTFHQDSFLSTVELYYSVTSTNSATSAIWEWNGSSYVLLWQGATSLNRTSAGWGTVASPNLWLPAGTYAIGWHLPAGTLNYYWNNSASMPSTAYVTMDDWESQSYAGLPSVLSGFSSSTAGGYHQRITFETDLDADLDGWTTGDGDCNDANANIYPGALELCDQFDGDCDGTLPFDEADNDVDGVPICSGDCDDYANNTYPGAAEACDGADNNCLGDVDEGLSADFDADGYTSLGSCDGTADDCDDGSAAAHPGAAEVCDGFDNDCNGQFDDGLSWDEDADGHTTAGSCLGTSDDCDDANPLVYPTAPQLCDGVDNPCLGAAPLTESDVDLDGQMPCEGDCDDTAADIHLGAPETCGNGVDDNCNGATDEATDGDGDGVGACDDCNDTDPFVFPGATEDGCNGVDDDCDGAPLEAELDGDADGVMPCAGDCDDASAAVMPGAEEVCDGLDNDCDGAFHPEEGPENDTDADGVPVCFDCDDSNAEVFPGAPEDGCDTIDLNCDGVVPDGTECGDDDDGGGRSGGRRSGCEHVPGGTESAVAMAALLAIMGRRRRR